MSASTPHPSASKPARPARHESLRRITPQSVDDFALARSFAAGDEGAFVTLMERYRPKIFNLTLGLLRNHADAEEITQDTFIRAHRGLANFRGDCSIATWLYRIAVNLSRNRYWYFFRRRRQDSISLDGALCDGSPATFAELVADGIRSPAQETAAVEFFDLVNLCMARLDAPYREILTQLNVRNRSYEEIATTLGLNVGTVKSRIARAREKLRALLTEACPEFVPGTALREWFLPSRVTYGSPAIASG